MSSTPLKSRLDPRRIEVVDEAVARVLRQKAPWQRVEMIFQANRTMRLLIEGGIRTWHPDWPDEQVRREVTRRMLLGAK